MRPTSRFDIGSFQRKKEHGPQPAAQALFSIEQTKRVIKYNFSYKSLLPFIAACLAVVLVLQAAALAATVNRSEEKILGLATSAYEDLNLASQNINELDFQQALQLFDQAQNQLAAALEELHQYPGLSLLSSKARSANNLLSAAADLAAVGKKLLSGLELLNQLEVTSSGIITDDFNAKLGLNRELLAQALDLTTLALDDLDRAGDLPVEYSQKVESAKTEAKKLETLVKELLDLEDLYLAVFGKGIKTYLLIFPNLDEARATGGFIGTYGILKIDNGKIKQLKIDSIYNFDGSLTANLAAPGPMQPAIAKWGLRDANWFADFPTSAAKMMSIFEKGSQTVDGVISLTPLVFESLLSVTGPIAMPQYGVVLTNENFSEIVQRKTSVEYDRTLNQPKKFLDDFAPALLNALLDLDQKQWLAVLQLLQNNLATRQILIFPSSFDGRIRATDKDFLSIVNSNLSGAKTDLNIQQEAKLQSALGADGVITNILTFTRINPTNETNKDFVRILVPLGSQLLSLVGADDLPIPKSESPGLITDPDLALLDRGMEAGKTVYSFWMNLPPRTAKTAQLSYLLPFRIKTSLFNPNESYSFLFQKQPAGMPIKFSSELRTSGFKSAWLSNGPVLFEDNIEFNSESLTDDFWSVVLMKQ